MSKIKTSDFSLDIPTLKFEFNMDGIGLQHLKFSNNFENIDSLEKK